MTTRNLTPKGQATRARIIQASAQFVRDNGLEEVSLDVIGTVTSTGRSQLFHYFPGGKKEVLREVFAYEVGEFLEAQEPAIRNLTTTSNWAQWLDSLRDYYFSRGRWTCPIAALAGQAAAGDPTLAEWLRVRMATWTNDLASGVAKTRGRDTPDDDDRQVAVAMTGTIQGGLVIARATGDPESLEACLRHATDWLV